MDRPRPSRLDGLGLRHAPGWRILPLIVAAMTFLAALAIAGTPGSAHDSVGVVSGATTYSATGSSATGASGIGRVSAGRPALAQASGALSTTGGAGRAVTISGGMSGRAQASARSA